MKRYLVFALFYGPLIVVAQTTGNPVDDAFLITRMAAKFHVQPKAVNDQFSNTVFNALIKDLDEDKVFFTRQDIAKLEPFRFQLDEQIKNRKRDFLTLLTSLYKERLQQAAAITNTLVTRPFNYTLAETFTVAEDSAYVGDTTAMRIKISKRIKAAAIGDLANALAKDAATLTSKKAIDSALVAISLKNQKSYKRYIDELQQDAAGVEKYVGNAYCKAIASSFDPHTEYFPLTEKENFESQLGNKPFLFGFSLAESDGGLVINDLMPGSPAFKCGMLNKGDKILSVQWENKQPIDVSDASRDEINAVLSASNHDKATFTVKKADGSVRQIILIKEIISDDADGEDAVKSFILKGEKNIGFISLPAFYTNWENGDEQNPGCAADVAKEIIKLKKENIQGLIIDLRYNGGGSMQEAVALTGIFIDGGPVEQVKDKDEKPYTLKDVNRGTVYDGPLVLLVNGYSASASEMLAGSLQDYNRALIVGTNTYGKATAQVVLPLDTNINVNSNKPPPNNATSYLKLTVSQLYRVTGKTAQFTGVQPDVILPDALQTTGERESDSPSALNVEAIEANKYFRLYAAIPKDGLQAEAAKEMAADNYFERLASFKEAWLKMKKPKDILLQQSTATSQAIELKAIVNPVTETSISSTSFTIANDAYQQQQIDSDSKRKEANDYAKKYLIKDPYLQIAFHLVQLMK